MRITIETLREAGAFIPLLLLWAPFSTSMASDQAPPSPPIVPPDTVTEAELFARTYSDLPEIPTAEWTFHKSADGLHPSGEEQKMLWLMNRARQDPTAEGIWLAAMDDPDVASARLYFGVDLDELRGAFMALEAKPPAAFDIRLHDASELHSLDMIARDSQDHTGQFDRVLTSGFNCNGGRASVFAYTESALHGHAALNIDWGEGPNGMQDPPGHRQAIMGVWEYPGPGLTNVGLALVADSDPDTLVGPLVFSGAYCQAGFGDFNRFIVGTVWDDLNANEEYDDGEALAGVTVIPDHGTYYAITGLAGGYAIPIASSGTYVVTFSGGDLGPLSIAQTVAIGGSSVLLDVESVGPDSDADGVPDRYDAFPEDPTETIDSDGDGVGDNADDFPSDPAESNDADGDGVGDNGDSFPADNTEWADTDSDGIGDNSDPYPRGRFIDTPPGRPGASAVELLANAGISVGCGTDNYCPGAVETRAQLAVILARALYGANTPPGPASGGVFLDVAQNDPGADYIERLAGDGIMTGCGDGYFCPFAPVTRDELAVGLLRLKYGALYTPPAADSRFADVPDSHWAASWIEQLAQEQISRGCSPSDYCPSQVVKRDLMAVLLARTLGLQE
jgi:hypothetical protein